MSVFRVFFVFFFFKQKPEYEFGLVPVGWEMCIRAGYGVGWG